MKPLFVLYLFAAAACATSHAGTARAPAPSPRIFETKIVIWDKRDSSPPTIPTTAKHVQLILSPGWDKEEHYAWVFADGTELIAVYRVTGEQRTEALDFAGGLVMPTKGTPLDKYGFGVLGSIVRPNPPSPPDPGGDGGLVSRLPRAYVEGIVGSAWNLNNEQAAIDGGFEH